MPVLRHTVAEDGAVACSDGNHRSLKYAKRDPAVIPNMAMPIEKNAR
jgi:hypothetical protein